MNPLVVIVGRQNVGKSRLFNRIISKKKSIVLNMQGTTRDTIYETVRWNNVTFDIVDTGGLSEEKSDIHFKINKRIETVVNSALIVLTVCDYKTGILPYDFEIAQWLRKMHKPVFIAVNKIDKPYELSNIADFYQLGFKDVLGMSAEHGYGVDEIMDAITTYMDSHAGEFQESHIDTETNLKLVFTGKSNVGKSSIINYIIGNDIMLVDSQPCTTRDPVELKVKINGKSMILIDTAGMKKGKSKTIVETLSIIKAKIAIRKTDIAVLVIDATRRTTGYDKKLISMIQDNGKGCVVALNKWDKIPETQKSFLIKHTSEVLGFIPYIPIVPISAVTGSGIKKLIHEVVDTAYAYRHRIETAKLNKFFGNLLKEHQPISSNGKLVKLYYIVQTMTAPPVFVVFTNKATNIKENYAKFIINRIREVFRFKGVPIKVLFRGKS